MRPEAGKARVPRAARLLTAALLAISAIVASQQVSVARPSHADLQAAKTRLNSLNNRLDILVEQYDQAQVSLQKAQQQLAEARANLAKAQRQARSARSDLAKRAALAYHCVGSELDTLLGSASFTQLSDRLEFLNQIAGSDASAVSRASVTGQKAKWAGEDLARAVKARTAIVHRLASQKASISGAISQQKGLIDRIQKALARPVYVPQAPSVAPAVRIAPQSTSVPVVNGSVQAVLDAAYSVIGVPYVYGGSSPETGFDCSGLTMWAWAHAGVSLPHSSSMQYDSVPHVSQSDLQPGDLLFFYSPIHHVALYVGGGMEITAPHTGAYVEKVPVDWPDFVGAGRP
jgi:peptidoglycan DL-endopeptidase CwlO